MKMRTRTLLLLIGGAFALVAAAAVLREPPPAPAPPPKDFAVGEIADSGQVVFYPNAQGGFQLNRDYAFMLINANPADLEHPKALYRLAINSSKKVIDETDWEKFKTHLDFLPQGTIIDRYVTCTAPQDYGLPAAVFDQIDNYCKDHKLAVRDALNGRNNVICTCGKQ